MKNIDKVMLLLFALLLCVVGMVFWLKKDESGLSPDASGLMINPEEENVQYIRVTFLDVGQGDATFIEFTNGEQMLVDCAIDARIIEALGRVMPYYDHDLDYLLITHPDSDHYGGCAEVLERFEVKNIIYSGVQKSDDGWQDLWSKVEMEPADYYQIDAEDFWRISSSTIHFLYPDHSLVKNPNILSIEKEVSANNMSVIFKLSFGENNLLMMGDAEEELEEYLLATYADQLDAEILKVAHHGSGSSSIVDFLNVVSPDYAVISCGFDNRFGHPSRRVLKRLERAGSEIWRTDLKGDIIATIYLNKVIVEYKK